MSHPLNFPPLWKKALIIQKFFPHRSRKPERREGADIPLKAGNRTNPADRTGCLEKLQSALIHPVSAGRRKLRGPFTAKTLR